MYGQGNSFTSTTANNGGLNALSLNDPVDLTIDNTGYIYVSDAGSGRVLEYQPAVPRSCGITLTVGGIYQYAPLVVDPHTGYLHPLGVSCIVDLRGYNLAGLEYGYGTESYGPYMVSDKQLALLTSGTTMNLVRVPYNIGWWLSDVYIPLANMHYRAWMDSVVQMIKRHGSFALSNPPLWRQNVNTLITTIQSTAYTVAPTMPPAIVVLSDQSYAGGFDELIDGAAAFSMLSWDASGFTGLNDNGLKAQQTYN